MKRQPYPLQWPSRLPRTKLADRKWSHFGKHADRGSLSPHQTGSEVTDELKRLGANSWVITSNLPSRGPEGIPYADAPKGDDPGIAVWFEFRRVERVFACDRWRTPAENLRAIAKSIEAMRGLDRWGVADVLEGVFAGFAGALPAGPSKQLAVAQLNGGVPWGETQIVEAPACVCQHCDREFHVDAGCEPCAFCDRCTELVLDKMAAGVMRFAPEGQKRGREFPR